MPISDTSRNENFRAADLVASHSHVLADITDASSLSRWRKYTVGFALLSVAGLTNSALAFTLPAKGVIHAAHADVSAAFAGTGILSLAVTLGDAGNNARYLASFTMLSTGLLTPAAGIWIPSMSATTDVKAYATAVGANLNLLSQGSLDLYVLWATLP